MSVLLSARRISERVLPAHWVSDYSSRSVRLGIALSYLALITLAELVTTFVSPRAGLMLHSVLLIVLLVHSALTAGDPHHRLLLGLVLAPLTRMLSLCLPLVDFPQLYWYLIISIPLGMATLLTVRLLGFSREQMGFCVRRVPLQLLVALTGITFGMVEYRILRPDALIDDLTWRSFLVSGVILMVCTGFTEEIIFRGIIQRASIQALGRFGLVYGAILFAVLHTGYRSAPDVVFVFLVALLFGWIAESTGSLAGVSVAHGITNIVLFIVMPFLMGY
jgi:membrane protease YdiL (CAAX protease family)